MTVLETSHDEKMEGTAFKSLMNFFHTRNELSVLEKAMIDNQFNPISIYKFMMRAAGTTTLKW